MRVEQGALPGEEGLGQVLGGVRVMALPATAAAVAAGLGGGVAAGQVVPQVPGPAGELLPRGTRLLQRQ
ncbi:hypothetical protein PV721_39710 [Streptomyces sp. MB09-01]|uniref:hypothetical protein n=1 Tax=Streptomyces sp. MB09-01 TaxID=3028666 RepID=UPI00299FC971|nr:hypothetical protein [Streptomyces sp. MB09-01]MDX3540329.1 hypothetical protein [Streptomyces sp. MB09-01]